jgi:hypothetical protein
MVAPAPNPAIATTDDATTADRAQAARKLTRSQVADQLGVSISTVRRLEGTRLHPKIGNGNTRLFDAAEVASVAASLVRAAEPAPQPRSIAVPRGELAARIFERFELRHSLVEIVIELRVAPDVVRELFHQWRVGLEQGESRRNDAVPPSTDARKVSEDELRDLLFSLPNDQPTRLSIARVLNERIVDGHRLFEVVELGGFTVEGPIGPSAVVARYGQSRFRVSAIHATTRGPIWQVITPPL